MSGRRVVILTRSPRCYSSRRLRESCLNQGLVPHLLDTLQFSVVDGPEPLILFKGSRMEMPDGLIPRIGVSINYSGWALCRQFEAIGVPSLTQADAFRSAHDKLRSHQLLRAAGLATPSTAFITRPKDIPAVVEALGGAPVILKIVTGTQGIGVVLCETVKNTEAVAEALIADGRVFLVQKFISESSGRDLRVIVSGGRVIAAMRRIAAPGEYRANVHRGGSTERVIPDQALSDISLRAAAALGLNSAGVDLLESKDGPLVTEVNSSPGFEGIEGCTGIDVAGAFVETLREMMRKKQG